MKKLSKKQIKQHNQLMDLKKELSLIFLATSFLTTYWEQYKDNNAFKNIEAELSELSFKTHNYNSLMKDVLLVAQNEMEIIEQIQRNTKATRFKKVCSFDEDNELVVSAVGLVISLLQLHKEHKNKKIFLSKNIYQLVDFKIDNEDEIRNSMIVASNFYDRICKYYDKRKL